VRTAGGEKLERLVLIPFRGFKEWSPRRKLQKIVEERRKEPKP